MNSKNFWRWACYALIALNLLFWLWNAGRLNFLGLGPRPVQEPHRVQNQIDPELLIVGPAGSAPPTGER